MQARFFSAVVAAVLTLPLTATAASSHEHAGHPAATGATGQMPMAGEAAMVDGTVKKIDKAAGKVTLAHGPLANLGMPAMTMSFRVKDNSWLAQMKEGGKIRFMADNVNGAMTVVRFESSK